MPLILCLETSSKNCSVSIYNNDSIVGSKEFIDESYCHGEKLHVLINDLLIESGFSIKDFDVFCFSSGPGSYTGLRIGAASVKGFSFALDKPIVAIPTLKSLAWGVANNQLLNKINKLDILCPIIDSRKGEVYAALYDSNLKICLDPFSCNIMTFSFLEYLEQGKVYFFGTGLYKLSPLIKHKNAIFINDIIPSSKYLGILANKDFNKKKFVDPAYFEPLYLKEFIPTVSKKMNT